MSRLLTRMVLAGIVAAAATSPALAARTQPRTVAEWPAVSGWVLPGPAGGVVSVGTISYDYAVAAYRLDGRRRWANVRNPDCGNCDGGQLPKLRPDGRYGPIGPTGDDYWAVSPAGKRVAGCTGVVTADNGCLFATGTRANLFDSIPALVRREADGTISRTTPEDGFLWTPESDDWPEAVPDENGRVYASYGDTYTGAPDRDQARVVAYDASGQPIIRRTTPAYVVAGLASGVLANRDNAAVALNDDLTDRWTLPVSFGHAVEVALDSSRDRMVVRMRAGGPTRARIVNQSTGAVEWTSPTGFSSSAIAVGASGTVYVALTRNGRSHVRAIAPDGTLEWVVGSAGEQVGILEHANGDVLISSETGIMTRLDPSRLVRLPARGTLALTRRTIRRGCAYAECEILPGRGAVLKLNLPSTSRLRYRIVPDGTRPPRFGTLVRVPSGRSAVRIPVWATQQVGPSLLQVRWSDRGRARTRDFPIVIRK
ncbi:MAG: hypothetical protein H6531_00230 [Actinobacteria bacterium]|nr:hypothetical protein [Thermoleophilia bacterium]MCB9010242.1 hypothetical protein [Actinomycetota bacterium]